MFERYTDRARRVIFFCRYEASHYGSEYIETEHLLLGLLREDKILARRFLHSALTGESIRAQIEAHTPPHLRRSTSVDLPLSNECKLVLSCAAEESERLGHKHIGPEHIFLGLLRDVTSFAGQLLKEQGLGMEEVRAELARTPHRAGGTSTAELSAQSEELADLAGEGTTQASAQSGVRDLTRAARDRQLESVIGRDLEINAVIEVLSRLRRRNLLLVGEAGVGKTAIVEGLAQRIGEGSATPLTGSRIVALDTDLSLGQLVRRAAPRADDASGMIVFIGDLRFALDRGFGFASGVGARYLKDWPFDGQIRCIATSTPGDCEECLNATPWLRSAFAPIFIRPLDEHQTLTVLQARKCRYEAFHSVAYSDEALQCAVQCAGRYLPDRALPGKALELLDAAAVGVKQTGSRGTGGTAAIVVQEDIEAVISRWSQYPFKA